MKIIRTAQYDELASRVSKVQDFNTTIQLYKGGTNALENIEVIVEWSQNDRGIAVHTVKDALTKEDLTDVVYDQSNKNILDKIKSDIIDMIGSHEDDAYQNDAYEVEMSRQDYKQYPDAYYGTQD